MTATAKKNRRRFIGEEAQPMTAAGNAAVDASIAKMQSDPDYFASRLVAAPSVVRALVRDEPKPFRGWKADAIYFCDNGATSCGACLGSSAMYTGRDISGQRIERVTPEDVRQWDALPERQQLGPLKCEGCKKEASRLHLPA